VIGAKKGWPNFNEFSIETFVDVTRKLEIIKQGTLKAGDKIDLTDYDTLAKHTAQIFLIGLSNKFGLEAWNSYAVANHRTIRIDAEIDASFGIDRITQRDASTNPTAWFPVFTSPNVIRMLGGFTVPAAPGWPGRQSDMDLAKAMATPGNPVIANGPSDFRVPIYTNSAVFPAVGNLDPYAGHEYSDATGFFVTPAQWMSISNTPDLRLNITNRIRYLAVDTAENKVIDYVTLDNLVTSIDLTKVLRGNPTTASQTASGAGESAWDAPWNGTPLDGKNLGLTRGIMQQITNSLSDLPIPNPTAWRSLNTSDSLDKQVKDFQDYIKGVNTNSTIATNIARQVPYSPTRSVYIQSLYQANDPFVHYLASDLRDAEISPQIQTTTSGNPVVNKQLGKINKPRINKHIDGTHGPSFQDPGVVQSDDWQFPIAKLDNNVGSSSRYGITNFQYRFPNIGALGQIHRGTPWQTVYLKADAAPNIAKTPLGVLTNRPTWVNWSGSFGTHPTNDWKLVGLFTTAMTENAARGLLSVNQTNAAAWSAVLSGVPVITNSLSDTQSKIGQRTQFGVPPPLGNFEDLMIEPGSPQLLKIVKNINDYRSREPMGKFHYLGQVLGAPMLSIGTSLLNANGVQYSPYLNLSDSQIMDSGLKVFNWHGVTDEALEAIPARILSLLKEDEPRVTIYCFGQTLRPAPRSYITSSDFYNLCVNYQVTGEYVTKAVVRVEGEMKNPNNPLRTVVESFDVLAPFE
jgi:hypothetical protein